MLALTVPTVACVIGEGGSGGAVAIAVSDRVLMQENAIYSVITPEGCAAILWRDRGQAKKAAAAFKPDALHCLDLGVIDGVVPEPRGGAQDDHDAAAALLKAALAGALEELDETPRRELRRRRRREVPRRWACSPDVGARPEVLHNVHRVFNHYWTSVTADD